METYFWRFPEISWYTMKYPLQPVSQRQVVGKLQRVTSPLRNLYRDFLDLQRWCRVCHGTIFLPACLAVYEQEIHCKVQKSVVRRACCTMRSACNLSRNAIATQVAKIIQPCNTSFSARFYCFQLAIAEIF